MKREILIIIVGLLFTSCAGITNYYNRDGWSYSMTQELFANRLVISAKETVLEKAALQIPAGKKLKGVASVKVLIDPDGSLVAVTMGRQIQNAKWLNKYLINAAKKSKFAKMKNQLDLPTHYISILSYTFR